MEGLVLRHTVTHTTPLVGFHKNMVVETYEIVFDTFSTRCEAPPKRPVAFLENEAFGSEERCSKNCCISTRRITWNLEVL